MFERFTDQARAILVLAQDEARLLDHNFIGTEHILLGIIREGEGVGAKALESVGISLQPVRNMVQATIGPSHEAEAGGPPPFTPRAKKVLELALREALQLGHNYIGTEHMLLGIIREGKGVAAEIIEALGGSLSAIRRKVIELLLGHAPDPPKTPAPRMGAPRRAKLVEPGPGVASTSLPIDPTALVTWSDVEEVLRAIATPGRATVVAWADGLVHRTCDYEPAVLPTITVSVTGAEVSSEAFEQATANKSYDPVDGLGDAAAYDSARATLQVLKESVLFSVAVRDHPEALAVTMELARKAVERLNRS